MALKDRYLSALLIILSLSFSASAQQQMFHWHNTPTSGGCGYDVDVCKFITKVKNEGGTVTQLEKSALNVAVIKLKDSSLWTIPIAIYPFVGSSIYSFRVNLKDTTQYNLTNMTTPGSWGTTSTGCQPAGQYANTGIVPNTAMSTTSGHVAFYSRTNNLVSQSYDFYASNAAFANSVGLTCGYAGSSYSYYGGYNGAGAVAASTTGLFMVNHVTTTTTYYKNGSSIATGTVTPTLTTQPLYLFGANVGGTPDSHVGIRECAWASVGASMTAAQALTYYNIIQEFQTTLSRQL